VNYPQPALRFTANHLKQAMVSQATTHISIKAAQRDHSSIQPGFMLQQSPQKLQHKPGTSTVPVLKNKKRGKKWTYGEHMREFPVSCYLLASPWWCPQS